MRANVESSLMESIQLFWSHEFQYRWFWIDSFANSAALLWCSRKTGIRWIISQMRGTLTFNISIPSEIWSKTNPGKTDRKEEKSWPCSPEKCQEMPRWKFGARVLRSYFLSLNRENGPSRFRNSSHPAPNIWPLRFPRSRFKGPIPGFKPSFTQSTQSRRASERSSIEKLDPKKCAPPSSRFCLAMKIVMRGKSCIKLHTVVGEANKSS